MAKPVILFGAKIAVNFRNNNICTKEECERLLSFTNNSGPLFIIGTCGISLFGNYLIGILLFITHILACITVGIIFKFWKKNTSTNVKYKVTKYDNKLQNITVSNLGEILGSSIQSAISTILMIGGFVVLFSVVISILNVSGITNLVCILLEPICHTLGIPSKIIASIFTGLFEITNGISMVSLVNLKNISLNIIVTAFLLGLGGLSVLLQVFSIVAKSDLSIKPYVIGKILHGFFAAIYTFLFINIFPFFNLNL